MIGIFIIPMITISISLIFWLSNKEMVLVGLRAIEIGLIFPKHFRPTTQTQEGKIKTFYVWRILLYSIGVEEQFNVFSWPTEDIEHIARYDFWTNIYPVIMNHDNLLRIKENTMHRELFDRSFSKIVYFIWENEIYQIAYLVKKDKSILGEMNLFKYASYSLLKNWFLLKLPNFIVIYLIRRFYSEKESITKALKKIPI